VWVVAGAVVLALAAIIILVLLRSWRGRAG